MGNRGSALSQKGLISVIISNHMLSPRVYIICVYDIYTIYSPKTIQFVAAPTNGKEGRNSREGIVISVIREGQEASTDQK